MGNENCTAAGPAVVVTMMAIAGWLQEKPKINNQLAVAAF